MVMVAANRQRLGSIISALIHVPRRSMMESLEVGRNDLRFASPRTPSLQMSPSSYVRDSCLFFSNYILYLQKILHTCVQMLETRPRDLPPSFQNTLLKACSAITQLLNPTVMHGWKTPDPVPTCELLCIIFIYLGNSSGELKSKHFLYYSNYSC
jgi:hypothetical protein